MTRTTKGRGLVLPSLFLFDNLLPSILGNSVMTSLANSHGITITKGGMDQCQVVRQTRPTALYLTPEPDLLPFPLLRVPCRRRQSKARREPRV